MKKTLIILSSLFLLAGCTLFNNTASSKVESFLKQYQSLDTDVLADLELVSESENLTTVQKEKYKEIMKMQYADMKYDIKNETVDGDTAVVTVNVNVYDLYKVQKQASDYKNSHLEEFTTNGTLDTEKYNTYKLDKMKDYDERVDYTIEFNLVKDNNKWIVEEPNSETLQKIQGTYNYEND